MSRRQMAQSLALDPEDIGFFSGRDLSRIGRRERKHLDQGDVVLSDEEYYARCIAETQIDDDDEEPRECASCGRERGCNCHVGEDDVFDYPESAKSKRGWYGHKKVGYYKHVRMEDLGYPWRNSFTLSVGENEWDGCWHYFVGQDYRFSRSERARLGKERLFVNGTAATSLAAKATAMRWLGKLLREKFSLPR